MDTYLIEAEFIFESYLPEKLKEGMHFLSKIMVGVIEPQNHFFTLEHIPEDEDLFMSLYGATVHLRIMTNDGEEEIIAEEAEIGWFDACINPEEDLIPINDKHINKIINDYKGVMDISCDEDGDVIYLDGKLVISYLEEEEEEE